MRVLILEDAGMLSTVPIEIGPCSAIIIDRILNSNRLRQATRVASEFRLAMLMEMAKARKTYDNWRK